MPADATTTLATFDATVAEAVAAVLRAHDIPVSLHADAELGSEVAVAVPVEQRSTALEVLAANMEQVSARAAASAPPPAAPAADFDDQEMDGDWRRQPLVLERLRRLGFLVVLLAPLMMITLAPALPRSYALALFIAGMVAVVWWRNRAAEERDR